MSTWDKIIPRGSTRKWIRSWKPSCTKVQICLSENNDKKWYQVDTPTPASLISFVTVGRHFYLSVTSLKILPKWVIIKENGLMMKWMILHFCLRTNGSEASSLSLMHVILCALIEEVFRGLRLDDPSLLSANKWKWGQQSVSDACYTLCTHRGSVPESQAGWSFTSVCEQMEVRPAVCLWCMLCSVHS